MDKWQVKIDRIKKGLNLDYDKEVAELLGISPQALSQYRKTETGIGEITKIKILEIEGEENLGDALDEVIEKRKRPPIIRQPLKVPKK